MPAINKPNQHFDASLYTGTGASLSIVNSGSFQPDLVWIKSRSTTYNHNLYDSVRGVQNVLNSNATYTENVSGSADLTAFNSNGFTVRETANYELSNASQTYVAWQWKAGGTAVTNTAGSVTSQVSANPTAGFSVVTYTSPNNTSDATIGHGLSGTPEFIIVKNRDTGYNWDIWHKNLSSGYGLVFDPSAQASGRWSTTTPTSSVFTAKYNYEHYSTNRYVAYCWTSIAGYSQFGSYIGNSSTDGPFVYLGFRPKLVLTKATGTANGTTNSTVWTIWDTSRNTYNAAVSQLYPNSSGVEDTDSAGIDILSNGFKLRRNSEFHNWSGTTYIYAAFAEAPFKFSNGR